MSCPRYDYPAMAAYEPVSVQDQSARVCSENPYTGWCQTGTRTLGAGRKRIYAFIRSANAFYKPSWVGRLLHRWIKLYQKSKVPEMLKGTQAILCQPKGFITRFTCRVTNVGLYGLR